MNLVRRRSVVDVALQQGAVVSAEAATRAKALDRLRLRDAAFRHMTRAAAIGVLVLLSAVIVSPISGSLPAIRTFGFGFLVSERWNPVTDNFGALPAIYGTVITSFIAMLIAVPVGLIIAFFLTELCPQSLRRPIGIAIERSLLWNGFSGLSLAVFTEMTPPPGASGGLLNPIVGSLILTILAVLIGTPIGILAGTYMAEYGRYDGLTSVVRFINEILLSAPSIVVGLFIYEGMVAPMRHFSGWAGGVALAVLVIPVVVRTTEDMLTLVPNTLREAATSIGLPRSLSITRICYRAARAGMVTGVLLAVARISGETAPLLFTSLNNQFWSTNLNAPVSSLPVVNFQFALGPYKDWQSLAWTGALIIPMAVLALSITARALVASGKQS